MDFKKVALLVSVLAVFASIAVPMVESDADTEVGEVTWDFDTMKGGSIWISLSETPSQFDAKVTVTEHGRTIYNETKTIEKGSCTIELYMPDMKSEGDHLVVIELVPLDSSNSFDHPSITKTIHVDANILSSWTTYVAIIIAVIVIAVIIYLRMRDKPKVENTMTFEQLEEERKAEMAAKSEKRKNKTPAPATSTEKKKYTGRKKE